MRTPWPLCVAATLLCAAEPASARGKLYQWVDKDGVTHVDDFPPPEGERAHSLRVKAVPPVAKPGRAAVKAKPTRKLDWWERSNDAPPDQIDKAAQAYNIPAELIRAVIAVESAGDTSAVSHRGAVGLMQLMPHTAGRMYVQDPVDPAQNILGGTRYLRTLANEFGGDMVLVLAAYNAGPEAVRKFRGVPPFEETRAYVRKVMQLYNEYKLKAARRGKQLASAGGQPASETRP